MLTPLVGRYIVLDTETTGLNSFSDRLVEVGCVEIIGNIITGNYLHCYVNPGQPNSQEAFGVHGLSDSFLQKQPPFADVAGRFLTFVSGSFIIAHNAVFDISFIDRELTDVGYPSVMRFARGIVDTYTRAKSLFAGKRSSLDALCDRFKVPRSRRTKHSALLDAKLLARLYLVVKDSGAPLWKELIIKSVYQRSETTWDNLTAAKASCSDILAHTKILQDINNATGGNCLWDKCN